MDPIKYLFEKSILTRRVARWQVLLSEYDITYVSQKAIKDSALANYLVSGLIDERHAIKDDFLDEEILALGNEEKEQAKEESRSMYRASNLMGHRIGAILMSSQGKHILVTARLDFDCANNMAEYKAWILGLHVALDNNIPKLEVYNDSALVIHQLRDEWETRDSKLVP
ncbi:uncharacterized protein LOC109793768 [Cajanus cajan]|uniref:uncharacterized protein LOC109793768 n=1 Tax=Cajanus cajan TaxID=3821 RepID=UPI00098D8A11|nr:uncharacterized protein LOC109793768 [Cajanus cajan]